MAKVLLVLSAVIAVLATVGFSQGDQTSLDYTIDPKPHKTAMGFSPWPADLTKEGVDRTYIFIAEHANLIAHHFDGGIPWDEAESGTPFPDHLRNDWANRISRTPEDFKVFVAVTPLNFDRDSLALAWTASGDNQPLSTPWSARRLNDDAVKRAYLNYVRRVIEAFDPDYLAIGIEANIMISAAPQKWDEYLELNRFVYESVKQDHSDLPVFSTVQYEHLRGIEDVSKPNAGKQMAAISALMQHSDLLALSTYNFGLYHPNPMKDDYFADAERFGKTIAIAEAGAMSKPVTIFGTRLPASEAGQAEFMAGMLELATAKEFPFVVNWVAVDFDPMIRQLPHPISEVAKAWVHTGLQTSAGEDKPAAKIWNAYLAASQPEK